MPLNPQATFVSSVGYVLTGSATAAAKPTLTAITTFLTTRTSPPAGFIELGLTPTDTLPGFGQSVAGGDPLKAWSGETYGQTATVISNTITFTSIQRDDDSLTLFHGGGSGGSGNSWNAPVAPAPTERAVLVVVPGIPAPFALFYPRVAIIGGGDATLATDSAAALPLTGTVLTRGTLPPFSQISVANGTV